MREHREIEQQLKMDNKRSREPSESGESGESTMSQASPVAGGGGSEKSSAKGRAMDQVNDRTVAASDGAVDDKVLRRRLQYKMHQRRHRAKQKSKIETLEQEVHALLSDVSILEIKCKRLQISNVFASRGTMSGTPVRVVREYFHMYQNGFSPRHHDDQERFLQCVMSSEVEGPDYVGIGTLKEQWRLYGQHFAFTQYEIQGYDVSTINDLTIVVVNANLLIRPRRDGVMSLCPNLAGNEELIQEVIGNVLSIPGKYRFIFDASGVVSWFGADLDFVNGMQRTLGTLEKVLTFMKDAKISFGTGQIQCQPCEGALSAEPHSIGNRRHNLDFLLS